MLFFFNDTATTEIYTFPYTTLFRSKLADAEAYRLELVGKANAGQMEREGALIAHYPLLIQKRSEEHTSELQSQSNLVCRPLLEKKNALRQPTGHPGRRRHATNPRGV